jgi:CHAT domain-containing protein/tetratricopeptide (TPR) repeat protein
MAHNVQAVRSLVRVSVIQPPSGLRPITNRRANKEDLACDWAIGITVKAAMFTFWGATRNEPHRISGNLGELMKAKLYVAIFMAVVYLSFSPASAQWNPEAEAANAQAKSLWQEGKLLEAVPYAKRFADLTNTNRTEDKLLHQIALLNIAVLADEMVKKSVAFTSSDQYASAVPLVEGAKELYHELPASSDKKRQQIQEILEQIYDRTESAYADSVSKVTRLLDEHKYDEAAQSVEHAIEFANALSKHAPNMLADALTEKAQIYITQGRYREAVPSLNEAVELFEKIFGTGDDPARYLPAYQRLLANRHDRLAEIYYDLDEFGAAEQHYKRALLLREAVKNPNSEDTYDLGYSLNRLGLLYSSEGRWSEAGSFFMRALDIASSLGKDREADVADVLNNLGLIYEGQGHHEAAEEKFLKALEIDERIYGLDDPEVATVLINLSLSLISRGASKESLSRAESHLRRALSIVEKGVGSDSAFASFAMYNLAACLEKEGRIDEAERYFETSLTIRRKVMGSDQSNVAINLDAIAWLSAQQERWSDAYQQFTEATNILAGHATREARSSRPMADAVAASQIGEAHNPIIGTILSAGHVAEADPHRVREIDEKTFEVAQFLEGSTAAAAIVRMAARHGTDDSDLAKLTRERQDRVVDWQLADKALSDTIVSKSTAAKEDQASALIHRQQIESRLDEIDAQIGKRFPKYTSYANPTPLTISDVQGLLSANEVLIKFVQVPEFDLAPGGVTIVWAITKTDSRRVSIVRDFNAIEGDVIALRCGLDYQGAWFDDKGGWKGSRCNDLLKTAYTQRDHDLFRKPLPFDLGRAHQLYKELFGQIEDLIKDKRLLIVPSGPLTQLPFQVLVTEQPKTAMPYSFIDYRVAPWLAREHALSVLPAVSSLKALREFAKDSQTGEPYIGFGNPLLDGEPEKFKEDGPAAKLAREKRCDPTLRQRVASLLGLRGGTRSMVHRRGGIADVLDIRSWTPLPETADELCDVAHDLDVDPRTHLYLGAMATETEVKQLSDDGTLAKYRIVHFATHGAVAGQVSRTTEPGLILTPPEKASETDDGYLSASEITGLKLDADWVILSACNTAAGGAQGAEALSGLARAFFYAGGRSLLVSHWEVDSNSTVKLITKAIAELKAKPEIGRAEALRQSMLSMIIKGKDYEAHPAFWAPFVLVGESGASR